jgi:hypothetical protein
MSKTGALIQLQEGNIEEGTVLEISVNMTGKSGLIYCNVIREQPNDNNTVSIGCQFVFQNEKQEADD